MVEVLDYRQFFRFLRNGELYTIVRKGFIGELCSRIRKGFIACFLTFRRPSNLVASTSVVLFSFAVCPHIMTAAVADSSMGFHIRFADYCMSFPG